MRSFVPCAPDIRHRDKLLMRRYLLLAVLLFALVFTVANYRLQQLDVQAMMVRAAQNIGVDMAAKAVTLTLFPEPGVRLDGVAMRRGSVQVEAEHVLVHANLMPFLFGKLELGSIHFNEVTFRLPAMQGNDELWMQLAHIPFQRVEISHGRLVLDAHTWLDDFTLDVRDIGRNRDASWEFQTMIENHLVRSYGRLTFRQGEVVRSFGKFKIEQVLLAPYAEFLPVTLAEQLTGHEQFSGSATFNLTSRHAWTLFGEGKIQRGDEQLVKFRGKVEHPEETLLIWRDAFVHFDAGAVIAIDGWCQQQACETRMQGKKLPLNALKLVWAEQAVEPVHIDGEMTMNSVIRWQQNQWSGQGTVRLKKPLFHFGSNTIALPEMQMDITDFTGTGMHWKINHAVLGRPGATDHLMLSAEYDPQQGLKGEASTQGIDAIWVPLANLVLASLDEAPDVAGEGRVQGAVTLEQNGEQYSIGMNFDATAARIDYASITRKPARMQAQCSLTLKRQPGRDTVTMRECRFGGSGVQSLLWQRDAQEQQLKVQQGALDFAQLEEVGLHLIGTDGIAFRGRVIGDFTASSQGDISLSGWLGKLSGDLDLHAFGTENWQLDGHMHARKGVLSSEHVFMKLQKGQVNLAGQYHVLQGTGTIHVLGGYLDWDSVGDIPYLDEKLAVRGTIAGLQVQWGQVSWHALQGQYRLQQGVLQLRDWKARLAEAEVTSHGMALQREDQQVKLSGDLHVSALALEKLPALQQWLGVNLQGRLATNLTLAGYWPAKRMLDMDVKGDMALYEGIWQEADHRWPFRKFAMRLQLKQGILQADRLIVETKTDHFTGAVSMDSNYLLRGQLHWGKRTIHIDGRWPRPAWHEVSSP